MDKMNHYVSLRLYEILDWIGASEEMRGKYREIAIAIEVIRTMLQNCRNTNRMTYYVFGSHCEGTTTIGLQSDVDVLRCMDSIYVVERISDALQHGLSFLMVTHETTKPGYVKLQCVDNKVPVYCPYTFARDSLETDKNGRLCLQHFVQNDGALRNNGPAFTCIGELGKLDTDEVLAYRCQHIPSFAKSWLRRVVICNRLNDTHIKTLKESGCFFVWKNHPSSQNGPIELRLSFSLQERELMSSLNSTQHKCYILLKIIKKDIILKHVPESISSYHCKTCLLYVVENTPPGFWTNRNLLECTLMCIKMLLHWVKEQYCPSYFVPDENMFDRLEYRTLRWVETVLEDMVEHWCTFLLSLTCDDIGKVLNVVLLGFTPGFVRVKNINVLSQTLTLYMNINKLSTMSISFILKDCKSISALHLMSELHSMQKHLLHTGCDIYHTEHERRHAIRSFLPHINLQIAQCVVSTILTTTDTNRLKMLFGTFQYYIEKSKDCDVISAYLIVACYCLRSDRYEACEQILLKCESSLKSHVVSVCQCDIHKQLYRNESYELANTFKQKMSNLEIKSAVEIEKELLYKGDFSTGLNVYMYIE